MILRRMQTPRLRMFEDFRMEVRTIVIADFKGTILVQRWRKLWRLGTAG